MLTEYRNLIRQNDRLTSYNRQIQELIDNQQADIDRKQEEIKRAKNFERDVLPLLEEMIATLDRWIASDLPFLAEDRRKVVADLQTMLKQADVPASEKFRRVVSAYHDESHFGRTIESYRGEIEWEGEARLVDFLRIGRSILLYQSLDNKHHGIWNQNERRWQTIPDTWRREISNAIRVARKQSAPDLLILPILRSSAEPTQ